MLSRELWACGKMQQNMRMVAAAFLMEHLRITWVEGYKWFDHTLIDADDAINAMVTAHSQCTLTQPT